MHLVSHADFLLFEPGSRIPCPCLTCGQFCTETVFTHALLCRAPDIDLSELETLFSTAVATNASEKGGTKRASAASKPEIVHLVWKLSLS